MTDTTDSRLEIRAFDKGAVIFSQGEPGDAAYIIDSGAVTIFQSTGARRIELATLKPGEIFGEMAVIDGGARMGTAVAERPTVVSRIPQALFETRLEATDRFIRGLLTLFLRNIRNGHRSFLRRPRSFRDNVKVLQGVAVNVARFGGRVGDPVQAEALKGALARLVAVTAELDTLAATLPDQRHHIILDGGEGRGSLAAAVLGSESERLDRD